MYRIIEDNEQIIVIGKEEVFSEDDIATLRDKHKIFHNNSCVPVKLVSENGHKRVLIGSEDDGKLHFYKNNMAFDVYWIDELIDNLRELQKAISTDK